MKRIIQALPMIVSIYGQVDWIPIRSISLMYTQILPSQNYIK
ncbi:hypothetical protein BMETH_1077_4 [methanotrophic bacterial endosymbiont of Bathymodiolus sp.]|nr:hypothetical protein BMETH_1077_4 [methanotrophic bacterial endosymbiont of Bathymodiolus sp.]